MYYPYLRGKQFELILLRDNANFIARNNIYPIIEPVKNDFKALIRAVKILDEKRVKYTLIINPQAGQEPVKYLKILKELIDDSFRDFQNLSIGYILHANSKLSELIALIKKYGKLNHHSNK